MLAGGVTRGEPSWALLASPPLSAYSSALHVLPMCPGSEGTWSLSQDVVLHHVEKGPHEHMSWDSDASSSPLPGFLQGSHRKIPGTSVRELERHWAPPRPSGTQSCPQLQVQVTLTHKAG